MKKVDKIKELHEFFIKKFKPKKPVILRFSNRMICHASYKYSINEKHYITLNIKDNLEISYENLQHEWAHLLEYNKWGKEAHSDSWGRCYARAYRAYLEWLDIQEK